MTPDLLLRGSLRAMRGAPIVAADLCRTLLARLPPESCIVALTLPGSRLDRALGDAVATERLLRHRRDSATAEAMAESAEFCEEILSDRDRDVAEAALPPWPGGRTRPAHRLRRLDTLYADSHRVGLIVIEDAAAAPAILHGAQRLLRTQAPAIVFDLAGAAPAERVESCERFAALLAPFELAWHDTMLVPVPDAARRREALLVLADQVVAAVPPGILPTSLPASLAGTISRANADLAELAWSGWRSPVAQSDRGETSAGFDPWLTCRGFHPPESDGHAWWRWSGPGMRATFAMPQPGVGAWRLRLDVLDWGVADAPDALQVFWRGRRLREVYRDGVGASFDGIEVSGPELEGRLLIEMLTPHPRRASENDPRQIGVNCLRATLERPA
jgi:hypothetical protein